MAESKPDLSCILGLKKVSKDQMTHKNPNLRASSVVPDKAKPTPKPAAAAPKQAAKKPPVFELKGKKWIVVRTRGDHD